MNNSAARTWLWSRAYNTSKTRKTRFTFCYSPTNSQKRLNWLTCKWRKNKSMMKWTEKHIKFLIDTLGNSMKGNMGSKKLIRSLKKISRAWFKSCQLICFNESDNFRRSGRIFFSRMKHRMIQQFFSTQFSIQNLNKMQIIHKNIISLNCHVPFEHTESDYWILVGLFQAHPVRLELIFAYLFQCPDVIDTISRFYAFV